MISVLFPLPCQKRKGERDTDFNVYYKLGTHLDFNPHSKPSGFGGTISHVQRRVWKHRRAKIPACGNAAKAEDPGLTPNGYNALPPPFPSQESLSHGATAVGLQNRECAGRARAGEELRPPMREASGGFRGRRAGVRGPKCQDRSSHTLKNLFPHW